MKNRQLPNIVALFAVVVLAVSCSNNSSKPTTSGDDKKNSPVSDNVPASSDKKGASTDMSEIHGIPSSAQLQMAYDAILKKAEIADPEMLELYTGYSRSIIKSSNDNAYLRIQMLSKDSKDKVVEFRYAFPEGTIAGPTPVTVSSGIGSDEKFIEKYEDLKSSLFKKSDILPFEKFDDLYKASIAKSEYKPEECYIQTVYANMGYDGKVAQNISIQSTKSITANKSYSFNKEGNITGK